MDVLLGKRLKGKYEVRSELAAGGMGTVYWAIDQTMDREVALKVLKPGLTAGPDFIQRFRREASAAGKLQHPNIVTIHGVEEERVPGWPGESVYFIVMEYIKGVTLDQLLQQRWPLPPDEANAIVQQVAKALDYAHGHGMIHRDVKPSNIMIDEAGQVKLMDFGLVRAVETDSMTRTGLTLGTPQYMSPEQANGAAVDRRSDIYSFGVVVYEILAHKVPFSHPTPMATLHSQIYDPPPPLRRLRRDVPPAVEGVVMRALAKKPAERYETAGDLAAAFGVASTRRSRPIGGCALVGLAALALLTVLLVGGWAVAWTSGLFDPPDATGTSVAAGERVLPTAAPTLAPAAGGALAPASPTLPPPTTDVGETSTPLAPATEPLLTANSPTPAPTRTPTPKPTDTPKPAVQPPAVAPVAVALGVPALLTPPDSWAESQPVVGFEWAPVSGAVDYVLETRSDRAGQVDWRSWGRTGGARFDITYANHPDYFAIPGTVYYWHVAAVDGAGRPGSFSPEGTFVFQRPSESPADPPTPEPPTPAPPTREPPPPTPTPEPLPTPTPVP